MKDILKRQNEKHSIIITNVLAISELSLVVNALGLLTRAERKGGGMITVISYVTVTLWLVITHQELFALVRKETLKDESILSIIDLQCITK